jgi:type II secretory ATPase GspE/PulE/Tfp pilus assembly ATPase PilB-like protein
VRYEPSPEAVAALSAQPVSRVTLVRGAGCASCRGTGFRGRTGIFELVRVTDALRDAITRQASRAEVRELAEREGFVSMRADGWRKVRMGLTTVEEVLRVVQG